MANILLFANNASSTLASSITNSALTASLSPGGGALFPSPTTGQYFKLTFTDAATQTLREIVHVTNVTGDVITMVRGQEGTTALNWSAGDFAVNQLTAGTMQALVQQQQMQQNLYNYAADTGTANSYIVTLNPAPQANNQTGMPVYFIAANANTGASTLTVNGTSYSLKGSTRQALLPNQILAGSMCVAMYEPATAAYILMEASGGGLTSTTQAAGDSTVAVATDAFVQNAVGGVVSVPVTSTSQTLTAAQYGTAIVKLTGTLTGNTSIIVPNNYWGQIENATSGAYTLTVKTASGTGVTLPQGQGPFTVVADGTNASSPEYNTQFAPLASPTFTGTPTAPTAAKLTNTAQLATTAFVMAALGNFNSVISVTTASAVLTSTNLGAFVEATGSTAGVSITLPSTTSIGGGAFAIANYNSNPVTLQAATGQNINIGTSNVSSTTLNSGDVVFIVTDGASWSMVSIPGLGRNQTWQTVTRATGTTYYNTTNKPIECVIYYSASPSSSAYWTINGATRGYFVSNTSTVALGNTVSFVVQPTESYSIQVQTGTVNIVSASELRN